jgi:hypothetical protein
MVRKIFSAAMASLAISSFANATLISEWNFESSIPAGWTGTSGATGTNPGITFPAEDGVHSGAGFPASGLHASSATIWSGPFGNGSNRALSSDRWAVGDYYQFCTSTAGYSSVTITWDQTGSNTGPREFVIKSSGDGYTAALYTATLLVNGSPNTPWGPATTPLQQFPYRHTTLPIPELDNLASVCIRFIDNSTTSLNGGTVGTAGTNRIDNVQFNGVLPEPGSLALLGIGLIGLFRRQR